VTESRQDFRRVRPLGHGNLADQLCSLFRQAGIDLDGGRHLLSCSQPMGTEQHLREGRIEWSIRAHLIAHPADAFSTDELCAACYAPPVERKHRVAVLRAIDKVLPGLPDWRSRWIQVRRGNMLVFYNAASVPSTAKAAGMGNRWPRNQNAPWDEPERLAMAERKVGEHLIMRDGSDEQRRQLTDRRAAERELSMAKLSLAIRVRSNPMGVLLNGSRIASGNMKELAEKARALMVENDPDAIRDGLAEIAAALDGMAAEAADPMAKVQEMLA
jgi:hypothetical protein